MLFFNEYKDTEKPPVKADGLLNVFFFFNYSFYKGRMTVCAVRQVAYLLFGLGPFQLMLTTL